MNQQVSYQDPVHMDPDGQWYFYNETWDGRYGPYPNPDVARDMMNQYAAWLTGQQVAAEQADQPAPTPSMQDEQLNIAVAEYIRMRDVKGEIAERHKREMAEVEQTLSQGEAFLLGKLIEQGVESFKVAAGTVYTSTLLRASLPDKNALVEHIRETGEVELLQARVSSTVLKDWMERNNGACPPGVSAAFERVVNVRRK